MKIYSRAHWNTRVLNRFARLLAPGLCAAMLLLGSACSTTAPSIAQNNLHADLPNARAMVAQVRQAGMPSGNELQVTPLRDPQVEDLRARATTLESQSDFAGAAKAIAQAITLVPDDPELMQQEAEFALYRNDWAHAETFAQQSFDRGPKLGGLCRRNWTTLRFVRLEHDDAAGAELATQHIAACTVAPPARY